MLIKNVMNYLEQRFNPEIASDFDQKRIGLIIGSENIQLQNIILTLDLNIDVIEEAIRLNANLIISHHPFIYDPLYKILFESSLGRIVELMYKHQISLYVMHTNLDVGINGVADVLANVLEINQNHNQEENQKDCFLRYGEIKPILLKDLGEKVKKMFNLTGLRIAGDFNKEIKTIGIVGGGGGREEDIKLAISKNIDCYITSEVKLNVVQYAITHHLCIIEVNHGIEKFVFEPLLNELTQELKLENKVFISKINTDPFIYLL